MQEKYWRLLLVAVFAVPLYLLATASAYAQSGSQGTIIVTVVDSSGGAVPGATLTLTELATNDSRSARSGNNGTYSFVDLPIGTSLLCVARKPGGRGA